ncbi:MAG: hypothetical protein QOE33_3794 [Acidobacteriota bacterium]|nr:hypothetical protein [Acidobacteriota bacterium]
MTRGTSTGLLDVGAQFHIHCNNIDRYLLATTIAPTTNIQSLSNIAPPSGNDNNLVVALAAEGHTAGTPINLTARQPDKEGVDETPAQEVKEAATLPLQEPKILGGEGDAEGGESRVGDGSEEEAHGESQAGEDGDVEMDTNSDAAKGESDDGHGEADGHSLSGEDGESSVDSEHEASGDAHGKKTLSDLDKGARQRSRMSLANRSPTPHHSDQHLSGGEDGDVNMEEQDDVAPQTKPTNVNVQREEDNGEVVQGDDEEEMGLGDDEREDNGENEGDNEEEDEGEEDDEEYFTLAPCFLVSPGRNARNLPGTPGICQIPTRFLVLPPGVPIVLADSWQIPSRFLADSWQIPGRLLLARNSWSFLASMGK